MKYIGSKAECQCFFNVLLHLDVLAHVQQSVLFQPGNLSLADADLAGDFHLRPAFKEAQAQAWQLIDEKIAAYKKNA